MKMEIENRSFGGSEKLADRKAVYIICIASTQDMPLRDLVQLDLQITIHMSNKQAFCQPPVVVETRARIEALIIG